VGGGGVGRGGGGGGNSKFSSQSALVRSNRRVACSCPGPQECGCTDADIPPRVQSQRRHWPREDKTEKLNPYLCTIVHSIQDPQMFRSEITR